jgi:hypothetical protein
MRKALEKAGVEFANGKKPGVRLGVACCPTVIPMVADLAITA